MAKIKITQVKSTIGYEKSQRDTVKRLGIKKMHGSVVKEDNPMIRGMIKKVRHLVVTEEVSE